jgi:hypothetical protein
MKPLPAAGRKAAFCTCSDRGCPRHPANHDQGCTPCIAKNLREGEIPSCFFNAACGPQKRPAYHYGDFARAVLAVEGAKDPSDASDH